MASVRCYLKPYIQPFERDLARRELAALAASDPTIAESGDGHQYIVETTASAKHLAGRLSYWERVADQDPWYTDQVLHESTVGIVKTGASISDIRASLPFGDDVSLPNRRALRYGTHGLHEYRGKFFPQLVRALINIAGVRQGGVIADPMAGSGTTLVEAATAGCHALGLDLNPLSVFMAKTKTGLLEIEADNLASLYERVRAGLAPCKPNGKFSADSDGSYLLSLPAADQSYLESWFAPQVLSDLEQVMAVILKEPPGYTQDLLRLVVSNILRRVSLQRDDDLRVRREQPSEGVPAAIPTFLKELERTVRVVIAFALQRGTRGLGSSDVREGDARHIAQYWSEYAGHIDAVITSPPYATALPYLDTDRLSLCYLGLLSRPEHRFRDRTMIGNREITRSGRTLLINGFSTASRELPAEIMTLINRVHHLNQGADVGFRRRNVAALLSKYFSDMRLVFGGIHDVLKPKGAAYVVVGSNHTVAGGQRIEIDTARLLGLLAEEMGLLLEDQVSMEMLVSRDIFRRNAGPSESILMFCRP